MVQRIALVQFTMSDFTVEGKPCITRQGLDKLNAFVRQSTTQAYAGQGTTGPVKPDNDIDMQNLYKVINQKK